MNYQVFLLPLLMYVRTFREMYYEDILCIHTTQIMANNTVNKA